MSFHFFFQYISMFVDNDEIYLYASYESYAEGCNAINKAMC